MKKNKIITYLQLHLLELKYNLIIFLITFFYLLFVSYYFSDQLIYLLVNNLLNKNMLKYFIFTNITEIVRTNFFISVFISVFISIQLLIILSWFFMMNGLYKFENFRFIKFYCLFIIFNFIVINFIFTIIIPYIWNFLLNLNFSNLYILTIYFEPKINNYFNFIFSSFSYIFLIFIYFFSLIFVIINNIFQLKIILNLRKFFYLQIILLSAIVTPADIIQFFIFYVLFILLFEIFLYVLLYLNKYNLN